MQFLGNMGFSCSIYNDMARQPPISVRPQPSTSDEKKNSRFQGHIVIYDARKPIYTLLNILSGTAFHIFCVYFFLRKQNVQ